jgi:pimeloyl-ACP methyl ester carboxylesterase
VGGSSATPSTFKVDPAHIVYMGQSLGGIIGTTATATSPDAVSAVLDVPAVGLVDVLEHTDTLQIRCALVDALIDAGVLVGNKSSAASPLCANEDWQAQPGYQQFSGIARWVLDPADGANFMARLVGKKFLIQEVVGDQVVPNYATDIEGALAGLMPQNADPATSAPPPASAAITTNPTANKWVRYPTLPAMGAFPGNTFAHASLLRPANGNPDGQLGTARLQSDAITFLVINH